MSKLKAEVIDVVAEEVKQESSEPEVIIIGAITITAYSNGDINLNLNEGSPQLQPNEIELLVRNVYDQLHESRITQKAYELFKSKL
jgi:hypothetical protein